MPLGVSFDMPAGVYEMDKAKALQTDLKSDVHIVTRILVLFNNKNLHRGDSLQVFALKPAAGEKGG